MLQLAPVKAEASGRYPSAVLLGKEQLNNRVLVKLVELFFCICIHHLEPSFPGSIIADSTSESESRIMAYLADCLSFSHCMPDLETE